MFKKSLASFLGVVLAVTSIAFAAEFDLEDVKCVVADKNASADKHADYKDGTVYFCCDGCAGKFAKDKDKFAVKANHQLVATKQYKQTACPFSGRDLDPNVSLMTLAGTKIGFCCDGCRGKVASAKDEAAKLKLVFADKTFAKGFKKGEKGSESIDVSCFCCSDPNSISEPVMLKLSWIAPSFQRSIDGAIHGRAESQI